MSDSTIVNHDPLHTPGSAARYLGVSRHFVIRLVEDRQIAWLDYRPPGSTRHRVRIEQSALDAWKASRRQTPEKVDPLSARIMALPRLRGALDFRRPKPRVKPTDNA